MVKKITSADSYWRICSLSFNVVIVFDRSGNGNLTSLNHWKYSGTKQILARKNGVDKKGSEKSKTKRWYFQSNWKFFSCWNFCFPNFFWLFSSNFHLILFSSLPPFLVVSICFLKLEKSKKKKSIKIFSLELEWIPFNIGNGY